MFAIGNTITVTYQARNTGTGKQVLMEVYDEAHNLDVAQSNTIGLSEIGSTGRYYDTFIPDAKGEWTVLLWEKVGAFKRGQVVKAYKVTDDDIDSVGVDTAAIKTKTDNLPSDPADQSQVEAAIDASEDNIRGADNDSLKDISDQIDALESPAMVG